MRYNFSHGCECCLRLCQELWEEQKHLEEQQRERREQERLEALRRKDKHEQSAVASSEVKQKLQGFILNKKHREAAAAASCNGQPPSSTTSSPAFRNWWVSQDRVKKQQANYTYCAHNTTSLFPTFITKQYFNLRILLNDSK